MDKKIAITWQLIYVTTVSQLYSEIWKICHTSLDTRGFTAQSITFLLSPDDYWIAWWPRRESNSCYHDGIGVVRMQRKQSEVSPEGDMTINVASVYFSHINEVMLDHSIQVRGCRRTPRQGYTVRVQSRSYQAHRSSSGGCITNS